MDFGKAVVLLAAAVWMSDIEEMRRHSRANLCSMNQNCLAMPACFSTALAVCRDRIFWSTGNRL
jgi:hypothetical protein